MPGTKPKTGRCQDFEGCPDNLWQPFAQAPQPCWDFRPHTCADVKALAFVRAGAANPGNVQRRANGIPWARSRLRILTFRQRRRRSLEFRLQSRPRCLLCRRSLVRQVRSMFQAPTARLDYTQTCRFQPRKPRCRARPIQWRHPKLQPPGRVSFWQRWTLSAHKSHRLFLLARLS